MDWDEFRNRRISNGKFRGRPPFSIPKIDLPEMRPQGILIALILLLLVWLATGIYIVGPDEQGVVLRFGKKIRITDPGPHYHLPYPIEWVETPKVTEVKRIEIGFVTINPGPPASYSDRPFESLMLTGDENIIDIDMIVQYRILDPVKFLFNVRDANEDLRNTVKDASEAAIREVIGSTKIDEALTTGKYMVQEETRRLTQKILDLYETGLEVVTVQLQDVHPPTDVRDSFRDVTSAKEDKNRLINEAQGYRNTVIPETRGKVAQILQAAEAYREEKIRQAQGDAKRFTQILEEYNKAKEVTRTRLYLETLEEILPSIEKFILERNSSGNILPILPLNRDNVGVKER